MLEAGSEDGRETSGNELTASRGENGETIGKLQVEEGRANGKYLPH